MMSLDWSRGSVEVDETGQESLWKSAGLAKGVCGSRQDWSRKSITTGLFGKVMGVDGTAQDSLWDRGISQETSNES